MRRLCGLALVAAVIIPGQSVVDFSVTVGDEVASAGVRGTAQRPGDYRPRAILRHNSVSL